MKSTCRECMRRVNAEKTFEALRQGGGNYRRPQRTYRSTICVDCAFEILERRAQTIRDARGVNFSHEQHWSVSTLMRGLKRQGERDPRYVALTQVIL